MENGLTNEANHAVGGSAGTLTARQAVMIAFPPAKAATEITFNDCSSFLDAHLLQEMREQKVWMAPMGKLALLYKERFWNPREVFGGLPVGRAMRSSPASVYGGVQVYDAGQTTDARGLYALVVFVILGRLPEEADPKGDQDFIKERLTQRLLQQLGQTFRSCPFEKLADVQAVELRCWRTDKNITKTGETDNLPEHPEPVPGLNQAVDGRSVWFVNAEASPQFTGMLEGAARASREGADHALRSWRE
eukprot:TRINITY_DN16835_c0_g1_i3.p1 TRINITY_DN16835_c0_g1~~TRINITY_DN16835_c0_g1_i3.p1  ORF type:complete len:248 (-),score=42.14 TRINITY_DN16835_c0_g1_i3:387-1130(-)